MRSPSSSMSKRQSEAVTLHQEDANDLKKLLPCKRLLQSTERGETRRRLAVLETRLKT